MTYRYTPIYRPADFCTVPRDYDRLSWGKRDAFYPDSSIRRDDSTDYGVIEYSRPLTDDEVYQFQLRVL